MKKLLALIFVALCTISIEAQTDDPITFADSKVKEICVANWDTNSDGELSTAEAAAVSDLGEVFESNPNINSFNELQYFTGLKSIGDGAFQYCTGLTSINIPNSVTSIGYSAFFSCNSLTDIVIPNSVVNIGRGAFEYTAWYDHQSEGVVYAGKVAYSYKGTMPSNTSIEFDEGTLSISDDVFYTLDNLISVTIPKSVVAIGRDAFACKNLSNIIVDADNKVFDSRDNCNAIIETATNKLIVGSVNTVIPNSVTSIGERAFFDRNLENIVIPESVTSIGDVAFYGCTFQNITIPKSVTSIGGSAFADCNKLQTMNVDGDNHVYDSRNNCNAIIETATNKLVSGCRKTIIPNSVSSIGRAAFANDTIDLIVIPESITFIDDLAFYRSMTHKDSKIIFKSSIPPTFGKEVFYSKSGTMYVPIGCKETYIMANEECKYFKIVEYENINFADAKVKELCVANWDTNGDGELSKEEAAIVTTLDLVFTGNTDIVSFREFQYFTGITEINREAFANCANLEYILLPKNVTTLSPRIFEQCDKLRELHIPASVTSINDAIIRGADGIEQLTVDENNPVFDSRDNCNAIINTQDNKLVIGCNVTVIPNTVITIGLKAFREMEKMETMPIPNSVTTIEEYAFADCSNLSSVTIPESVTNIGDQAFWGCHNLTSVTVLNKEPIAFPAGLRVFSNHDAVLNVPDGSKAAYEGANEWKEFGGIMEILPFEDSKVKELLLCADFGDVGLGTWKTNVTYDNMSVTVGDYVLASDEFVNDENWNHTSGSWSIVDGTLNQSSSAESCISVFDLPARRDYSYKVRAKKESGDEGFLIIFNHIDESNYMMWNIGGWVNKAHAIEIVKNGTKSFAKYESGDDVYVEGSVETGKWYDIEIIIDENYITCMLDNVEIHKFSRSFMHSVIDINADNVITKEEVASLTNIGVVFRENDEITSFNELQYFTGITSLSEAFYGCSNLVSVKLPESLERLRDSAFENCTSLSALHIPANVNFVGNDVIRAANALTVLTVDENNEVYDSRNNCNAVIETATNKLAVGCNASVIPNTVTTIGLKAFREMVKMETMPIPNSVTTIEEYAFADCNNLSSVTIPESVTNIGDRAFWGCDNLTSVTVLNKEPIAFPAGLRVFSNYDAVLKVPAGSKTSYKNAEVWKEFKDIVGELTITLNQYGKSTYCSEYALDFTNVEGLKAYVATGYNTRTGVVTMTRVMTTKGGTGLFLKGEQGSYKVPVIEESDDNTLNLLVGTLAQVTVNSEDDTYTNYKFTVKAGETEPGFYNFEDNSTLSANKAYLRIPKAWLPSTSAAKSVRMWFEDEEATGIDEINTNRPDSDTIYDMQGRRVKNPSKGMYIVNGKKMIMK